MGVYNIDSKPCAFCKYFTQSMKCRNVDSPSYGELVSPDGACEQYNNDRIASERLLLYTLLGKYGTDDIYVNDRGDIFIPDELIMEAIKRKEI